MALCDICNAPGKGTVVKASDMSNAVCKGFDPFKEGLMDGNVGLMYTFAAGNSGPEAWRQSAISGRLSMSDWNICDRCMNKLRPYLLEKEIVKCGRCGRSHTGLYCIKCDMSYWWSVQSIVLILAIASIMIGVFQCNPGFWRWFWIVLGAILCMGRFNGINEDRKNRSIIDNDNGINPLDCLIDYENGTIPLSDLPIGTRVMDPCWEWEFRTGYDYTGSGAVKPVAWLVVAKDHYEGLEPHVTLLSEELIGLFPFDYSTNRSHKGAKYGRNHWGESGTGNAFRGLRPWLNSTGIHSDEGFYRAFSESFRQAVLTTTVPNKEWQNGSTYNTEDKVFIPSITELGLGHSDHDLTYPIGSAYPFFSGASNAKIVAMLGGKTSWYWTRTPNSRRGYEVRSIASASGFGALSGIRPAVNLKSGILVSISQQPVDEMVNLKPEARCNSEVAQASDADTFWEKAISAAEDGADGVAVEAFLHAIEINPDYYISIIKPETHQAEMYWKQAVETYLSRKDAEIKIGQIVENHCVVCGKSLGNQWHYFFESLSLDDTIGTQCPDCNRTVCREHMGPASDGENPRAPCPECNGKVFELQEGPADSSLVEKAQAQRRYRGGIKEPSALGRTVINE